MRNFTTLLSSHCVTRYLTHTLTHTQQYAASSLWILCEQSLFGTITKLIAVFYSCLAFYLNWSVQGPRTSNYCISTALICYLPVLCPWYVKLHPPWSVPNNWSVLWTKVPLILLTQVCSCPLAFCIVGNPYRAVARPSLLFLVMQHYNKSA